MKFKELTKYDQSRYFYFILNNFYTKNNLVSFFVTDKNLIKINNIEVKIHPKGYTILSGIGVTIEDKIVLQYLNKISNDTKYFLLDLINPFRLKNELNPVSKLREIEIQ